MKWHSVRGRGFLRNVWEENVIFYVLWYLTLQINTVHYGLLKWMISVRGCSFLTINPGGVDEINLLITYTTIYHGWFWIFHASLARSADGTWVMVRGTEIFPLCNSYKCFIMYYSSADFAEFPHIPICVPWLGYQSKKKQQLNFGGLILGAIEVQVILAISWDLGISLGARGARP